MGILMSEIPSIVFEQKGYDSLGAAVWRKEREIEPQYYSPGGAVRRVVVYDYLLKPYHNHIRVEDQVIVDYRRLET